MREVTIRELMNAIPLETGTSHRIRVLFPKLYVRLPIDPRKAEHWDDRFILTMDQAGTKTAFIKTVRDDHIPGDAYVDLIFNRLIPEARYTLTVEPGAGQAPYNLFEDQPHDQLFTA